MQMAFKEKSYCGQALIKLSGVYLDKNTCHNVAFCLLYKHLRVLVLNRR